MSDPNDLTTLVPPGLIKRLGNHFSEGIEEAVAKYRFNETDEDSLTGALGQALSTPRPIAVTALKGALYSFVIESHKILGKGPGTPESRTGADGIIQISVESEGKPFFAKGLPFQAKKLSRYREAEVATQAEKMLRTSHTGIVMRFSDRGYDARDVRHIAIKRIRERPPTPAGFTPLATVMADWFLRCKIGVKDLRFDREVSDPTNPGKLGFWVIDTRILKVESNTLGQRG